MGACLRKCIIFGLVAVLAVGCGDDETGSTVGENSEQNVAENDRRNIDEPEGEPQLAVSGEEALSWELEFGDSDTEQFEVANVGGGVLEFEIESKPWLALQPEEGEVWAGESMVIDARAVCEKGVDIERMSSVEVTSNGGDHAFETDLYCGPIPPAILQVEVSGLPEDADHDIEVVAEADDDTISLPQSSEITLAPGTYHVEPNSVGAGLGVYEAQPETVELQGGVTTEVEIDYQAILGELPVVIGGDLPEETDADVDLVGDQETRNVSETETVELPPGEYDVEVHQVFDDETGYKSAEAPEAVEVESGPNDELLIEYELLSAQLDVEIIGDLGGNDPDVDITGPDGFSQTVTGNASFEELVPGDYTVEPHPVSDGSQIYEAGDSQVVTLESGDAETVVVEYESTTGEIVVELEEIGETDYQLSLIGPDNFEEQLDGDVSFPGAPVGDYEVVVDQPPIDPYGNDSYVDIDVVGFALDAGEQKVVDIAVRAAYIVVNEDDDGPGSLRFVIGDVLDGTVVQFIEDVSEIEMTGGDITVDKQLDIAGPHQDPVVIDGADTTRLFRVDTGGDLTISDLVMRNGYGDPGGAARVVDDGRLVLRRVSVEQNQSAQAGGAIAVTDAGSLEVYDCRFVDNVADGWGSAIDVPQYEDDVSVLIHRSLFRDNYAGGNGGAVDTSGTLEIAHSTFVGNHSAGRVAGVMVFAGTAVLEGLTVVENGIEEANFSDDTGGVYVNSDADAALRGSVIAENEGGDVGGTVQNISSGGFSVIGEVDNPFQEASTDVVGVDDAGLEELEDNGGYSATMVPTEQSPAYQMMFGEECIQDAEVSWSSDQRRVHRPAGAFCSAGACELDATVETFDGADMSRTSFNSTVMSFSGVDGIEWDYYRAKRQVEDEGDQDAIDGTSVVLDSDGDGWISAPGVSGGITSISMILASTEGGGGQPQVEVFVDGVSVGTSPDISTQQEPYTYALELDDGIDGVFDLTIESIGSAEVVVDNVSWR